MIKIIINILIGHAIIFKFVPPYLEGQPFDFQGEKIVAAYIYHELLFD